MVVKQAVAVPTKPTAALVEQLNVFLSARFAEADGAACTALEYSDIANARATARVLYIDLATRSAGYLTAALEQRRWNERARYRWWLLLSVARPHRDHPDMPTGMRPFLDIPEWQL